MAKILEWNSVTRDSWTHMQVDRSVSYIIYELRKLPDFKSHRYNYLGKDEDNRQMEVAKLQLQMLRNFHGLGSNWGISLRIVKKDVLTLYLLFRYSGETALTEAQLDDANLKLQNALMKNEYTFKRVNVDDTDVFDISWANEAAEVMKDEQEYKGAQYPEALGIEPQKFYVPYAWMPADNNMEYICRALMRHEGLAVVDITLVPTVYLEEEKNWINVHIGRLKECMNGETLRSPKDNKILWQGDKLPVLKTPLDNCEKTNKQYEMSRMFISSIRVFADARVDTLANALVVNSVKNDGRIQVCKSGFGQFAYLKECYENVDVSASAHSVYWNMRKDDVPFRAQRFNRLVSIEEISNFFRIPIPVKPNFPGFQFDTGLDDFSSKKKARSIIRLGNYLDEMNNRSIAAEFDSQQLAKHGLIVGVPGSGKTTAMFNILYQLWAQPEEQKIPFIVLEPAKTEYRALKTLPEFKDDLLVFTLGDEGVSPFRFNPMEVLPGIKLESHISKLQACFIGAFDLFDPLPIFLEQAIRRTYTEKGWYDDSRGGEEGLETPTISDLCRNAEYIVSHSGFDSKMKSDFQASLLERLNSLRRGSKGRMLDTKHSIPMEELMNRPVVLELDSLNGDEKSLLMMFLLSYVYEYCKVARKSGSPLKHMLLVEEAHNLIGASGGGSDSRANPKEQTIELFVNMLAEMRALGQGILIADQLPTAIAPQAVKQTNVKILMRVTARDDREEIGNTMDLNEEQMHQVVNFKTGHAYVYHEGEDHVRMLRMLNFKGEHDVEEPPTDDELKVIMGGYEESHPELYYPYEQCSANCKICDRRVRNQAESFVQRLLLDSDSDPYKEAFPGKNKEDLEAMRSSLGMCGICYLSTKKEAQRLLNRYKKLGDDFGYCAYVHILNKAVKQMEQCRKRNKKCKCSLEEHMNYLDKYKDITKGE